MEACPTWQQTENHRTTVAEQLAHASAILDSFAQGNHDKLQDSEKSEAKKAMQQYLIVKEPSSVVTEDYLLCHVCRDNAHIQADKAWAI